MCRNALLWPLKYTHAQHIYIIYVMYLYINQHACISLNTYSYCIVLCIFRYEQRTSSLSLVKEVDVQRCVSARMDVAEEQRCKGEDMEEAEGW